MRGRQRAGLLAFVFLGPALAGCFVDETPIDPPVVASPMSSDGVTAYLHDLSTKDDAITVVGSILEQHRIAGVGGIKLDTWIVRPDVDGPVPIILEVTPYYNGGPPVFNGGHRLGKVAEEFVPRGYAVGVSSVRGTGTSEGCFTQGGPDEAKDTAAVVEYLAAQSWSNGRVGILGVSYPGTTPQDVWIEAPPHLATIVPISGISDFYKYNFVNGVPINVQGLGFNTYYWALEGPLPDVLSITPDYLLDPTSFATSVAGEACTDQLDVQEGGVSSTVDGNKDGYWQLRDFAVELAADWARNAERAPVFFIHGLQDWNVKPHMLEDWLPLLQETGVPHKIWLGQWEHNWPQREDWWNATLVAWFDTWLKGVDTGVMDAPTVQVQDDLGRWRHETEWPPVDVDLLRLYPDAAGTLLSAPGGGSLHYFDFGALTNTMGQTQFDAGQAVFASEPFANDTVFSGLPRFVGNATADDRRAHLVLSLVERLEDGTERPFNFAALSLNHALDLAAGDDDITGKRIPIDLRFFPQDDTIAKGSRVILYARSDVVLGGEAPDLAPISILGTRVDLDLEGAWLELPVDSTLVIETPQPCWEIEECYLVGR